MIQSFFKIWNRRLPTFGHLSLSLFFLAVISGVPLVIPYDISHAFDSIQLFTLLSPAAVFYRAAHYWSGQLFVIATIAHVIEHLTKSSEKEIRAGVWIRLSIALPVTLLLMLTGFIIKADSEGVLARQVLEGLLVSVPFIGESLRSLLLGKTDSIQLIYAHHLSTSTIFLLIVIIEHARRIWPELLATVYATAIITILAITAPPALELAATASVKGPWYFVGLREILKWIPYPFPVIIGVTVVLVSLVSVKWMGARSSGNVKRVLGFIFILYGLLSMFNWFFRDNNWNVIIG